MTTEAALLTRSSALPLLAAPVVPLWAMIAADSWMIVPFSCLLGWWLLSLAILDIRHYILPDALTLPLIPAGLVVSFLQNPAGLTDALLGVVGGFAAFWLVREIYYRLRGREGLGFGDVKLMAGLGAWLGGSALPGVVLIAALAGLAAVAVAMLQQRQSSTATLKLPFGAFLAFAAWIVWLHGPVVLPVLVP